MDGLHDHLARAIGIRFFQLTIVMCQSMTWISFKSEVLSAIERFIPSKMTKTKYMPCAICSFRKWK